MVFEDPDEEVRAEAFTVVTILGPLSDSHSLDFLLLRLTEGTLEARWRAAQLIGGMREYAANATHRLLGFLNKKDQIAPEVAKALGRIAGRNEQVATRLRNLLEDQSAPDYLRAECALALGRVGGKADVEALLAAARSDDAGIRGEAAGGLGELRVQNRDVVNRLVALTADPYVKRRAAWALGRLGNTSEEVVTALTRLLSHDDVFTRRQAIKAFLELRAQSPHPVVALLNAATNDSLHANRLDALESIVQIGTPAIPTLRNALLHGEIRTKRPSATALAQIPSGWKTLAENVESRDVQVGAACCFGMRHVPKEWGRNCEGALIKALARDFTRAEALFAIQDLGLTSDRIVRAVGVYLANVERDRFAAWRALEIVSAAAEESRTARELLRLAAKSSHSGIAASAKAVLKELK